MARYSNKELSYIGRQIALSLTHERFTTEYLDIIISNHRSLLNPFLLYCIGNSLLVIQRNQTKKYFRFQIAFYESKNPLKKKLKKMGKRTFTKNTLVIHIEMKN